MVAVLLTAPFIYKFTKIKASKVDINNIKSYTNPVENIEEGNEIKKRDVNELLFLAMGVDAENTRDKVKNGIRTDTMMIVKVNYEDPSVEIISIPRDSRVDIQGKKTKINHAHAYGGDRLALQTVRNLTGLDIDYYVTIDYNIVKSIVDIIGGVDIDVPLNMKYTDPYAEPPLKINLKKGLQKLDGDKSIQFLRFRHNNNYTIGYKEGDIGRIEMQQYFIKELMKQTLTPKNILNGFKFIETYYDNIQTNIPITEIALGVSKLPSIAKDLQINTTTVPGTSKTIDGISYYIINNEELAEIISKKFNKYKMND